MKSTQRSTGFISSLFKEKRSSGTIVEKARVVKGPNVTPQTRDEEIHHLKCIIDEKDFAIENLKREVIKANEQKELELRQLKREKDGLIDDNKIGMQRLIAKMHKLEQDLKISRIELQEHRTSFEKEAAAHKKLRSDHQMEVTRTTSL